MLHQIRCLEERGVIIDTKLDTSSPYAQIKIHFELAKLRYHKMQANT